MAELKKTCYICKYYDLCRLLDKARDFSTYANTTGNLLLSEFPQNLYELMASTCVTYKRQKGDNNV